MLSYPRSDFDRGDRLLQLLGTFWASLYDGRDHVRAYASGCGRAATATFERLLESLDNLSKDRVRVLSRLDCMPVTILKGGRKQLRNVRFGDGGRFGDGLAYGMLAGPEGYEVTAGMVRGVSLIGDRLLRPTHSLVHGLDFAFAPAGDDPRPDAASLVFRVDPFSQGGWATRPIIDGGEVVDTELTLWLFDVGVDREYIWRNFGHLLGLKMRSSEGYKQVVGAMLDAIAGGTSRRELDLALAAILGVPLAAGGETVEAVFRDRRGDAIVVTDRDAYNCGPASPVVAEGDAMAPGAALCDAFEVAELNAGALPPWADSLALGRGFLLDADAELVFRDAELPLEVSHDAEGYARVSCPLGGDPAAVRRFWDEVHRRGRAAGRTLAHLLDVRPSPAGEPTALNLPATLNPLRFLASHLFRGRVLLVKARGGLAGGAIGFGALPLLRKIIPPGTAVFFLVDMPTLADSVDAAGLGGGPGAYDPMKALWGFAQPDDDWTRITLAHQSRTCQ
jgi:hypothetical protein